MLRLRHAVCSILFAASAMRLAADPSGAVDVSLWPSAAPGAPAAAAAAEREMPDKGDGIRRITDISRPRLTVFSPASPCGTCVLVCPGGGYNILAISHEGLDVCA